MFVETVIGAIYHHLGLFLITLAFASLGWKLLQGKKNIVPKDFALLYGIGGLILAYHMQGETKPYIVAMEVFGALVSLALALL